jgi:hypothetical protein
MAPRKKTGRSAAEAAYAALLKDNTALVGDVGEAWDALDGALSHAAALRERYEEARSAAVKAGAVTNDQLDQMGYKKTPKIPALPSRPGEETGSAAPKPPASGGHGDQSNGAAAAPQLASVGAPSAEEH